MTKKAQFIAPALASVKVTVEPVTIPFPAKVEAEASPTNPHLAVLREWIDRVIGGALDCREFEIIKLRYGLGDGYNYTVAECAHIFKISLERVRQLEARAIRKLQQPAKVAKASRT